MMFGERSDKLEFIDTGEYTPEEYEGCLVELRGINRWLGDESALKNSLLREIRRENLKEFSVLDVGAGSGELLRVAANFIRKLKRKATLTGLELNPRSVQSLLEESKDFAEINAVRGDALNLPFDDNSFDYSFCSLFTHHFPDQQVVEILREMRRVSRRGIFILDLHRHQIAYFFYTTVLRLVIKNRLTRHDGALSILRSFTPQELKILGLEAGLKNVKVERHFPYRLVLSARKN